MELKVVVGLTNGEFIEFYENAESVGRLKSKILSSSQDSPWYNYNFEPDTGLGWFNINSVVSLKIYDKI